MSSPIKILIAHDGSENGTKIIDDLAVAGLPSVADVTVLSVAEFWLPPPASYGLVETEYTKYFPLNIELAQSIANQTCQSIKSHFPDWHLTAASSMGSPAQEILRKAEDWKPDLIIVGSQGLSTLGRFFFGSVSQKVVNEAHCSVRVARLPHIRERSEPVKIVIGIDGSNNATAAVQSVANRCWPAGSEARLVTSIGSSIIDANLIQAAYRTGIDIAHKSTVRNEYLTQIRTLIQEKMADLLAPSGLKVSFVVKEGNPKQLLINEAKEWGADTIFLGSRGLSRVERMLLGSVSSAVVSRAECSVEIVR